MAPAAVDNKQVLRSFFGHLNARDFDAAAALMAPDVAHHTRGAADGDIIGPEAWMRFARAFWGSFPDRAFVVHDMAAEDDRVAVRLTWAATHQGSFAGVAATGLPVEINGISLFRLENGKIAEQWLEQDMLKLHQQLGAAPGHSDNWPK